MSTSTALVVAGVPVIDADTPVASEVLSRWEEHEAYAQSVLMAVVEPAVVIGEVVSPRTWRPWQEAPPSGWMPWPASCRERLSVLGETLLDQEERLEASQLRWHEEFGHALDRRHAAEHAELRLQQQAQRLWTLRQRVVEVARRPADGTLDQALRAVEESLRIGISEGPVIATPVEVVECLSVVHGQPVASVSSIGRVLSSASSATSASHLTARPHTCTERPALRNAIHPSAFVGVRCKAGDLLSAGWRALTRPFAPRAVA